MKQINSNLLKNIRVRSYVHTISKEKQPIREQKVQTPEKINKKNPSSPDGQATGICKIFLNLQKEHSKAIISSKTVVESSKKRLLTLGKQNRPQNKKELKNSKMLLVNSSQRRQNKLAKTQLFQKPGNKQYFEQSFISKNQTKSYYSRQPEPSSGMPQDDQKSMITIGKRDDFILKSQILQAHDISFNKSKNRNFSKSNFFSVEKVLSVTIRPQNRKRDFGMQTYTSHLDDKYYIEYIKYRELKDKSFEQIMNKQEKLKSMIRQSQEFNKHYQNLFKYINQGPENDRQRRVFALSVNLEKHERKIEHSFNRIYSVGKQFEKGLQNKLISSKKQSTHLLESAKSLLKACIKSLQDKKWQNNEGCQLENDKRRGTKVIQRILGRVFSQLKYFEEFYLDSSNYGLKVIETYCQEGPKLKQVFEEWKNMQYENRVLLYNFMKQIQKIPSFTVSLFGYDEGSESIDDYLGEEQRYVEKKFDDYMETRCERCFEMKNKIKLMQHNNIQVKPVFKVVQWLVRDAKKQQTALSLI